jgi:hypothetical protein
VIVIWSRSKDACWICGAETTSLSSTIASDWLGQVGSAPKHFAATALKRPIPSSPDLKVGATCQSTPVWSRLAAAPERASPVRAVGPSR